MSGKKFTDALKGFDRDHFYTPSEALGIVKTTAKGGFDESVDGADEDSYNSRLIEAGGKIWLTPAIRSSYFLRRTFPALARQYREYGAAKGTLFARGRPLQPRHDKQKPETQCQQDEPARSRRYTTMFDGQHLNVIRMLQDKAPQRGREPGRANAVLFLMLHSVMFA